MPSYPRGHFDFCPYSSIGGGAYDIRQAGAHLALLLLLRVASHHRPACVINFYRTDHNYLHLIFVKEKNEIPTKSAHSLCFAPYVGFFCTLPYLIKTVRDTRKVMTLMSDA